MFKQHYNILFLCWDNATYSPVAESLMCRWSGDQVSVNSAGIQPAPAVHPAVLSLLREKSLPLPSHPPRSPSFRNVYVDYIFLLDERICPDLLEVDSVAAPVIVDWRLPAFQYAVGYVDHHDRDFRRCFAVLENRVRLLTCNLFACLEQPTVSKRLIEIPQFDRAREELPN